jgi:tRNA nucleotidyltransferase (CCA-adding enzyme)
MAKFYQVGGCVRDMLMGHKSKDIDFVVEAASYDAMKAAVIERGCDIKLEKPEYLTIRAVCPQHGGVDFVLARKDGNYYDGRRPETVEAGTLFDDLQRRDFTCNAIAMHEDGTLIDPYCGALDIASGILAAVGNARDRFEEDKLRILRALRFAITKNFILDHEIIKYIKNEPASGYFTGVSVERVREELNKCFKFNTLTTLLMLERFPAYRSKLFFTFPDLKLEATLKKD